MSGVERLYPVPEQYLKAEGRGYKTTSRLSGAGGPENQALAPDVALRLPQLMAGCRGCLAAASSPRRSDSAKVHARSTVN